MLMLWHTKLILYALAYFYPNKDNVFGLSMLVKFLVRN